MSNQQTAQDQGQASAEFEAALAGITNTLQAGVSPDNSTANQTPVNSIQSESKTPESQPKVKVGEEEYSVDQLTDLVKKGKVAKEWESSKPGYNLDSLYSDYTRKSQKLAEFERSKQIEQSNQVPLAPEEQAILKKAVEPLIENRLQQDRDAQALKMFKQSHPEYSDQNGWQKFATFFNDYYKLPTSIESQLQVMEMAHQNLNFSSEVERKAREEQGKKLANLAKSDMASLGGGGVKVEPQVSSNFTPEQIKYMETLGVMDYAKQKGLI